MNHVKAYGREYENLNRNYEPRNVGKAADVQEYGTPVER
jgi:hypothetical protein